MPGGLSTAPRPRAIRRPGIWNGNGRPASTTTTFARAGASASGRTTSDSRMPSLLNIAIARQTRVRRQQKILAVVLQAVAGEIHEDEGIRPGRFDLAEELAEAAHEVGLPKVGAVDHVEADAAQRLGNEPGVVERGLQRTRRIGGIADDEGNTWLGLLGSRGAGSEPEGERNRGHRPYDPARHDVIPWSASWSRPVGS